MALRVGNTFYDLDDDLVRMMNAFDNEEIAQRVLETGAQPVKARMRELAPVDIGKLRDSIDIIGFKRGKDGYSTTIGARKEDKDYYAPYVEYGHGGPHPAPPRPFARPAFDQTKDEAFEIIKRALGQEIDRMKK